MSLLHDATPLALWHHVVQEAEVACSITLKQDIEAYLVFLLMKYTTQPEVLKQIIALEVLESMTLKHQQRAMVLQEVGDKCLLFSGLFPGLAQKRLTKLSYFVRVGQAAYGHISEKKKNL